MRNISTEKIALQSIKTKPLEEIRLYSRRMSHEFPIIDTSFDAYYRECSVGVPFLWESRPGTPKFKSMEFPLPPLTPPPSFNTSPISKKPIKKQPRNIAGVFRPKLNLKKQAQYEESPSRSMASSSSSPWSTASLSQRRVSDPLRLSYDSRIEEDEECESPDSTLCFRGAGSSSGGGRRRSRGCSPGIFRVLVGEF